MMGKSEQQGHLLDGWMNANTAGRASQFLENLLRLLERVNFQLEARGLIVKKATIVDATLVAAATQRPKKEAYRVGEVTDPEAT